MPPRFIGAIGTDRRTSGEDHTWRSGFDLAGLADDGKAAP